MELTATALYLAIGIVMAVILNTDGLEEFHSGWSIFFFGPLILSIMALCGVVLFTWKSRPGLGTDSLFYLWRASRRS